MRERMSFLRREWPIESPGYSDVLGLGIWSTCCWGLVFECRNSRAAVTISCRSLMGCVKKRKRIYSLPGTRIEYNRVRSARPTFPIPSRWVSTDNSENNDARRRYEASRTASPLSSLTVDSLTPSHRGHLVEADREISLPEQGTLRSSRNKRCYCQSPDGKP